MIKSQTPDNYHTTERKGTRDNRHTDANTSSAARLLNLQFFQITIDPLPAGGFVNLATMHDVVKVASHASIATGHKFISNL